MSTGTWTNSPTSYSYQWVSGSTNVGTNQNTYVLQPSDVGNYVDCVITAANAYGSTRATSNSVGPVTGGGVTDRVLQDGSTLRVLSDGVTIRILG